MCKKKKKRKESEKVIFNVKRYEVFDLVPEKHLFVLQRLVVKEVTAL